MTPRPRALAPAAPLLAAALLFGCACPRCPETAEPPPPAGPPDTLAAAPAPAPAPAGYAALREQLHGRDLSPLRGRRVVLDPGHGGFFRGALGPGGLAEADVNLGVALHLRGLLEWAGATALMTRTSDRDFLAPGDSSLARDLAARVAFADSARPDVFVSIHHNSNAARDTTLNALETYYPAGRDGADLDLARAVHRHLARNLEIAPARILPGNFRVLRGARAPAVLGEASMISNPAVERRLALGKKQELEAQAYFLGLLDYFAGGTPRWTQELADSVRVVPATVTWRFAPGDRAGHPGPGLDGGSVALTLDGAPVPHALAPDGLGVTWTRPAVVPAGPHALELRGRNLGGRAAPLARVAWFEEARIAALDATLHTFRADAARPDRAPAALLAIDARDQTGRPAPLREPRLRAAAAAGAALAPSLPPRIAGGRVRLRVAPADLPRGLVLCAREGDALDACHTLAIVPGELPDDATLHPLATAPPWPDPDLAPGGAWRARLPWPAAWDSPGLLPLRDPEAPLLCWPAGQPFWLEADGALPLVGDAAHRPPWAPAGAAAPDTLVWRPLLPALVGATVLIDPAGGGADFDGSGPSGTRGSDLNLAVARSLAALLRGAGARALLTRDDERWIAPEAKLLQANAARADLVLVVRRARPGEADWTIRHHEASPTGRRWARLLARAAVTLAAPDTARVAAGASYLLRQTTCPALAVALPAPRDGAAEERLEHPSHQAATARALFLAIAALRGGEGLLASALDPAALIDRLRDAFPPLAQVEWAQLDGNLPWLPPRWCAGNGASVSSCRAPGLPATGSDHFLEVRARDGWRLVALRRVGDGFAATVVLQGGPAR